MPRQSNEPFANPELEDRLLWPRMGYTTTSRRNNTEILMASLTKPTPEELRNDVLLRAIFLISEKN